MKTVLLIGILSVLWACQPNVVLENEVPSSISQEPATGTEHRESNTTENASDLTELSLPDSNQHKIETPTTDSKSESTALAPVPGGQNSTAQTISPEAEQTTSAGDNRLSLEQATLGPLQEFEVRFQVNEKAEMSAWAGIVTAEIPHGEATLNDIFDLAYAPLGGNASGILVFTSPEVAGNYEVRLFSAEAGQELAAVSFQVKAPVKPLSGNEIRLSKAVYAPGEQIQLEVSILGADKIDETAWLGIVPSAISHGSEAENDAHLLAFQYLGPFLAGKMTFQAPSQPGLYDFRLHDTDDNGREIVFVSFLVHS